MKLKSNEVNFLSIWAREEKQSDPYDLPAHRLQAEHQIPSVTLIRAIKAWARLEGKRDEEIFMVTPNAELAWPWSSSEETRRRLDEILASPSDRRTPA